MATSNPFSTLLVHERLSILVSVVSSVALQWVLFFLREGIACQTRWELFAVSGSLDAASPSRLSMSPQLFQLP
jgi:hypothetical protein